MSCLLCVSIIRLSVSPLVPLLFVTTPLLESLSPSQFSLPSQLLSLSLHPCLPPRSVPQSLPHYRRVFLSLCHFSVSPAFFPPSLDSLDSPSAPTSLLSSFSPSQPHSPLAPPFPHSTDSPMTFYSLTGFLSIVILVLYISLTTVLISLSFSET